ncbi:hypothetical protein [Streptosporangium sp. NPDC002607]
MTATWPVPPRWSAASTPAVRVPGPDGDGGRESWLVDLPAIEGRAGRPGSRWRV